MSRFLINQRNQLLLVSSALQDCVLQFFQPFLFRLPLFQFGFQLFHTLQFRERCKRGLESNRQQVVLIDAFPSPRQNLTQPGDCTCRVGVRDALAAQRRF